MHRALDVNENRTRMHNRAIVYICARVCYTYVCVHGAALRMCLVRPGYKLRGAYAVAVGVVAHELAVACSTG